MTELDLERLKSLPVPPASAEARKRAVAAAVAEFDQMGASTTQGTQASERLTHVLSAQTKRKPMRFTRTYVMAASLAVLGIAVPLTLYHLDHNADPSQRGATHGTPPVAPPSAELDAARKA